MSEVPVPALAPTPPEAVPSASLPTPPATTPVTEPDAAPASAPTAAAAPPPAPQSPRPEIDFGRIAQDLQIRKTQVEHAIGMLEDGCAVPYIALYRRERVGGLSADQLRHVQRRLQQQKQLAERKQTILRNIQALGRLTDELRQQVLHADTPRRLEDLYLPYKPRKKSFAHAAREKGLEPLALSIWSADAAVANLSELLPTFVNPEKQLTTPEEVLAQVKLLLAELIAETAAARETARRFLWETAKLTTAKMEGVAESVAAEFKDYHQFSDAPRHLAPHRILAINRGEKAKALKVRLDFALPRLYDLLRERLKLAEHPHGELLLGCLEPAVTSVLVPALEREMRRDLTEKAEEHAVHLVARNLRRLLMQPPLRLGKLLAIHPAHKGGCRLAVLDEAGQPIDHRSMHLVELAERPARKAKGAAAATPAAGSEPTPVIEAAPAAEPPPPATDGAAPLTPEPAAPAPEGVAPTPEVVAPPVPPQPSLAERRAEAKQALAAWITQHGCTTIALGQGLGFRELEEFLGELISEHVPQVTYYVVSEAGLNQYIVSTTAREELPSLDPATRGAVALGRRLLDPLAEFVKIDPVALSIGLHHYDLPEKRLKEALLAEVEDCINLVGVDVNTASASQLRYVAGLNPLLALAAVQHRQQQGPFRSRADLANIPDWSPHVLRQAAGVLRIVGDEPLDQTPVHPDDYEAFRRLLQKAEASLGDLQDGERRGPVLDKLGTVARDQTAAAECGCPAAHLLELAATATRIGVDPRAAEPKPLAKTKLLRLEDLQPGQELHGMVQNVVDFGAFIDIGLKDSGLVHISQLANRFIKSPYDLVAVGDVVTVWVINIDQDRKRVSLTMIPPGTERKPPERKPPVRERREAPPQSAEDEAKAAAKAKLFAPQVATPNQKAPPMQSPPPRPPASERPPRGRGGKPQPPPRTVPPPRKERPRPPAKLTSEALQGATPLRTFGELKALYEAKKPKSEAGNVTPPPAEPPAPPAEASAPAEPPGTES